MIPGAFEYLRPETLEEAIQLLQENREEAVLLAGGHSLIPILKARLAQPGILIDISRIPGLKGIGREEEALLIGGMTTHHEIESAPEVAELCPILSETASLIGDVQVRNRGTIGGSLAHADPSADYPAVLIALDAEFVITGPDGARSCRAENFFEGPFETAMEETEILTSIIVPAPRGKIGGAYCKEAQQASGFAVCGVAAAIVLGAGGEVESASVGVTGVSAAPYRAAGVESALTGQAPSAENIEAAADHATDDIEPIEDLYGSAEFRGHLTRVWTKRALERAIQMAGS